MDLTKCFTIGEASKICGIPSSTMRYYDQINLVKPSIINSSNQYRYYTYKEIAQFRIVQDLRGLGLSIDEIQQILKEDNLSRQLEVMEEKRDEIGNEIRELKKKFNLVDSRIYNIKKQIETLSLNDTNTFSVTLKYIQERKVLSVRNKSYTTSLDLYIKYFNELIDLSDKHNINQFSRFLMIHHHINLNNDYDENIYNKDLKDIEVCGIIQDGIEEATSSIISYLPEGLYLSFVIKGMAGKKGFERIYRSMKEWIKKEGYIADGPLIDVLLSDVTDLQPNKISDNVLTEVQMRIVKSS